MNNNLRSLCIFFTTIFMLSEDCNAQHFPNIGYIWNGLIDTKNKLYLPPPHGFENRIDFKFNNINFRGAVKNGNIIYISTVDSSFVLNKVNYIGKPLSYFRNRDKIKRILGWAHYLPIDDGWYAAFGFESVSDTSKVLFLFKADNML